MPKLKPYWMPLLISLFFVVIASIYALSTAPFEAPDEGAHLSYVHHLLTTGTLPVLTDYETMWTVNQGQLAGHHPPLYYFLLALPMQFLDLSALPDYFLQNPFAAVGQFSYANQNAYLHPLTMPDDTLMAVKLARFISIGLTVVTLWMVYLTAYTLRESRLFAAATMLFAASIPTFVFIGSSINNDNLATLIFAAGTLYSVRIWKAQRLTLQDGLLLGVLLGGAALTKLNTIFIFVVIYSVLLAGVLLKRFTWHEVLQTGFLSAAMSATFAGWWYWRNWQLYADPFALEATLEVWGRGSPPDTWGEIWLEARGVWESFWYALGNLNIRAADWVYTYINVLVIGGVLGLGVQLLRDHKRRSLLLILLGILGISILALILATQQINVSQGRILFPSIAAFTTLLLIGWQVWLGKHLFWLPIVPLTILMGLAPFTQLQVIYRFPVAVDALPADATPLEVQTGDLELLGYRYEPDALSGQDPLWVDLWIRGTHPDDPSLFIKLIDPVSGVPVGGVDTYPNMTRLRHLDDDTIYHLRTRFAVDDARITGFFSRQLQLRLGWRDYDRQNPDDDNFLTWEEVNGNPLDALIVAGPAFINSNYVPPAPDTMTTVQFGDRIRLNGYTLSTTTPDNASLDITTHWQAIEDIEENWIMSVGLLNDAGDLVAQDDAPPQYFPTTQWQQGLHHLDTRTLTLPDDLTAGTYQLYIALYRRPDFLRLPVSGEGADNTSRIYRVPQPIVITAPDD